MSGELYQEPNVWKRRSFVVVGIVIAVIPILIWAAIEGAVRAAREEWRDTIWSIKRAWHGPK